MEKRRTLLGWGVAPIELEKTADQKTAHADLVWREEEVLGGLPVHVQRNGQMADIFFLVPRRTVPFKSAKEAYDALLPGLVEKLGEPQFDTRTPEEPEAKWTFVGVAVALLIFDRFGPTLGFHVRKTEDS